MTTSRVEKLAQMGISFTHGVPPDPAAKEVDKERKGRVRQCDEIYRAALARVGRIAEHVDRVNALQAQPFDTFELSEAFLVRDRSLVQEIETEWLSEAPDLERFKELVATWEENCLGELKAKLAKMSRIPD
jgi:hypothetical protein